MAVKMVTGRLQRYAMDSYISDVANPSHTTIIFTLSEEPGALAETLRIFKVKLSIFIIRLDF
jgi:prephenate dehydratase